MTFKYCLRGGGFLAGALMLASVATADVFVFPREGQSEQQMEKDKFSCYQWARDASGHDPMNPARSSGSATAVATPEYRPGRNIVGGAARGAIIAGIADGDAGKGAAIGAIGGGVFGGMRHQRQVDAQRRQAAERQAAEQSALNQDYQRAYSACLEGKGYTVR